MKLRCACDIPSHAYTYQFALVRADALAFYIQQKPSALPAANFKVQPETLLTMLIERGVASIFLVQPRYLEVPRQSLRDFRTP